MSVKQTEYVNATQPEDTFVEITVAGEILDELKKLKKKELVVKLCEAKLEAKVAKEEKDELQRDLKKEVDLLESKLQSEIRHRKNAQEKLNIAESYIAQAKAMVYAVMDSWDEY